MEAVMILKSFDKNVNPVFIKMLEQVITNTVKIKSISKESEDTFYLHCICNYLFKHFYEHWVDIFVK